MIKLSFINFFLNVIEIFFVHFVISLSNERFRDFSQRGSEIRFLTNWYVKLHDISYQTPDSESVEDFFAVRYPLIML